MRLLVTPSFVRAAKKLHRPHKADLDEAVRAISGDPEIGEAVDFPRRALSLVREWLVFICILLRCFRWLSRSKLGRITLVILNWEPQCYKP